MPTHPTQNRFQETRCTLCMAGFKKCSTQLLIFLNIGKCSVSKSDQLAMYYSLETINFIVYICIYITVKFYEGLTNIILVFLSVVAYPYRAVEAPA